VVTVRVNVWDVVFEVHVTSTFDTKGTNMAKRVFTERGKYSAKYI
jgi:hypothetical protein